MISPKQNKLIQNTGLSTENDHECQRKSKMWGNVNIGTVAEVLELREGGTINNCEGG
jgi:hypothetical protein